MSEDFDESSINIDSSVTDSVDDTDVMNFLNTFINTLKTAFTYSDNDVTTVTIPMPYGGEISIPSDIVSSYVGTWVKTIVNLFWYFIFGKYLWAYAYKLVSYIKDGSLLEGKNFSGDAITSEML